MKFIKIYDFELINKFLSENFSSPTHWPEWNLMVSKYYKTVFYYLGLIVNDELTGICPVHETKSGLMKYQNSGQIHFIPYGGWLLNRPEIIDTLKVKMPVNTKLEIFGLPSVSEFNIKYEQTSKLFYTLLIDLKESEDKIWSAFIDSKRRNMIRKSLKFNIKIETGEEILGDFYTLYSNHNNLKNLEILPLTFFKELIKMSKYIFFMPFVAYKNNIPIAAAGIIHDKNYALYWLGAMKHDFENLGQGELLQWEAIKYSKAQGCRYYDLCYIEKERLPNIYGFKKGFSRNEMNIPYLQKKQLFFRIFNKLGL